MNKPLVNWESGDAYERWVGRWSRSVGTEFLQWLGLHPHLAWADVGCGTGQLTTRVLSEYDPQSVVGLDASGAFVAQARRLVSDPRARFETGNATSLPWETSTFDVAVSGLVLNFVEDHLAMTREMARVTRPGGVVAAYVWDYAGGMQIMRHFWDVVVALNPNDANADPGGQFPLCRPEPLRSLYENAGLRAVKVRAIDIPTVFQDFEDFWTPFLGKQGSAPTYVASLTEEARERIREALRSRLASTPGPIELTARAWAVQGVV